MEVSFTGEKYNDGGYSKPISTISKLDCGDTTNGNGKVYIRANGDFMMYNKDGATVNLKEEFPWPATKRYLYFTIRSKSKHLDPNNHLRHFEKGSGMHFVNFFCNRTNDKVECSYPDMSIFELGPAEIHYAFDAEPSCVYSREIIVFDVAFSFSVLDIPVQKVYNNFDVTLSLVGFPKQDWFEFEDGLGFKLKDTIYRCSAASAILGNIKEAELLFESNDMYVSSTFRDSCNLRIASFSIIGHSVKQEPVGVSIKMESDSPRMNLTWSEHYAHTLSTGILTNSIDYTFTCEEEYPFWKFIDGEEIALNFDSGVLARVGVEDTVVNNVINEKYLTWNLLQVMRLLMHVHTNVNVLQSIMTLED